MHKAPWVTFGLISLFILVGSLLQLHKIYPLYTDAALRLRVQEIISLTAEQKGLLLSGIEIKKVTEKSVLLSYREYLRGKDHITCFDVSLVTPTTTEIPCTND